MNHNYLKILTGSMTPLLRLAYFGLAFCVLTTMVWGASFFINDEFDRQALVFFNLQTPVPILDQAMLLLTKATMPLLVILFLFWLMGFWALRHRYLSFPTLKTVLRLAALIIAIGLITSPWWFRERDIISIYPMAAVLTWLGTEAVLHSFTLWDDTTLHKIRRIIWVSLAAVLLTYLARNAIAHAIAPRPRPFNDVNLDWNFILRGLRDERVVYGSSYVSGHASTVFALIVAPCQFIRIRAVRIGLIIWAIAVCYSRLYLAAHYPYCVIIGVLLGISAGLLATRILVPRGKRATYKIRFFTQREQGNNHWVRSSSTQ